MLAAIVAIQTGYDASLHLVQWFHIEEYHPLYPIFPNLTAYNEFWFTYYAIAAALCLSIIFLIRRHIPPEEAGRSIPP